MVCHGIAGVRAIGDILGVTRAAAGASFIRGCNQFLSESFMPAGSGAERQLFSVCWRTLQSAALDCVPALLFG